jgi:O-antigen/teichoic acid export membrane protein
MARLRDQLLATFVAEGVNLVSGVVFGIMAARALAPEGRGIVAAAWSAVTISVLVSGLGVSKSLVSRLNDRTSGFNTIDYYSGLIVLSPLIVLFGWGVLFPLMPDFPPDARKIALAIIALAVPVIFLSDVVRSILRARRRIYLLNATSSAAAITRVIVMGVLWYLGKVSIVTVLMIEVGFHAFIGIVGSWALRHKLLNRPGFTAAIGAIRSMLSYGTPFLIYSLLLNLVNRLNVLIVERLSSAEEAGYFAIGIRLAEYLGTITLQISFVFVPYLAQMPHKTAALSRAADVTRTSMLFLGPAAVVLVITANTLIPALYGSAFAAAAPVSQIMALGVLAATVFQFSGIAAIASGDLRVITTCAAIGFVLNMALSFILIPHFGAMGAALSATMAHTASLTAHVLVLWIRSGISPWATLIPKRTDVVTVLRIFQPSLQRTVDKLEHH